MSRTAQFHERFLALETAAEALIYAAETENADVSIVYAGALMNLRDKLNALASLREEIEVERAA